MKRKITFLISALFALMLITQSFMAWGQTRDNLVLTFSFTSNPNSWPTSNPNSATDVTYTLNSTSYTFNLNTKACYNSNQSCLFLTGSGGALGMPAISGYKLVKVEATNTSGCSTAVTVGISTSNSSFSAVSGGSAQTWSTQSHTYTYTLTGTSVNTMYYLYDNKSSRNAQVASLTLTYEPASCNPPTFLPAAGAYTSNQSVTISSTTDGATIYYTTDGTTPTTSSLTAQPVSVATSMTIKAIAVKAGLANSSVSEAAYTISQAYNLTITSEHGTPTVTVNSSSVTPTAGVYSIPQGATVNLSVAPDNGYMFTGWTVNSGGVTITNNAFTMPNSAVSITANYEAVVSDVISHTEVNNAIGSQSSSTYYSWSGVQLNTAVYAGQSMYNKDNALSYIQIRNTSPSGIVTTTSGGYAKKIRVDYAQTNTNDRSLTVYGKHTAYTEPADLYDSNKRGEVLGTITFNTNDTYDELTIDGNWEYIGLLAGGAMYFEPITITWLPVTMYSITCQAAYYIPETETQIGAVTVDKASAAAGTTINLTAEGMNHYHFNGWTVTNTTTSAVVSVTGTTTASFTMPASNVTVAAAWEEDTKYTITKANGSTDYITVAANSYADETVNVQIHDLPDGKVVDAVTVTKASSGTVDVSFTGQEAGNYNYTYTMPAENVTISVSFKEPDPITVTYYVKGQVDKSETITAGNYVTLPTSTTTVDIDGFTLLGWSTTNGGTTTLPAGAYYPEETISLYAVLGVVTNTSLTITPNTSGLPTSYQTANTFVEYTLEGQKFKIQQGYKNGTKLQWRASGNNNGTGTMYNTTNFGRITSIVLVYDDSDTGMNFSVKAGTTENPTGGTSISQSPDYDEDVKVYTYDLTGGNYTHFVMTNGSGAGYLLSITIYYTASATVGTVTEITDDDAERSDDIEKTECVVVKDGGILTFTGKNNGDATNLIIENGGQLFVGSTGVKATIKKTITPSEAKTSNAWYAISSPTKNLPISTAVSGTHNVYRYDEENVLWEEYRNTANLFTTFENGRGYLYRSTNGNISFAEEVNYSNVTYTLSRSSSIDKYKGFNLIGNPYSHDIYKGSAGTAIPNGSLLEDKYCVLETDGTWTITDDGTPIPSGTAILVQAKAEDELTIYNIPSSGSKDRTNNDNIWFTVSNNDFKDAACVEFKEGRGFNKMYHYNENAPMLYISYNGENFASVDMSDDTKVINLNFKAATMGKYTLSLNANGNFSYLHIIDKLTGEDVDMLLEGEYSFIASPNDNDNRFLVYLNYLPDNGSGNDIFVYQNGNDIYVTGNGELQIFDVTGRRVMTTTINGAESINLSAKGVFIFRLIGSDVKTQKIVVE